MRVILRHTIPAVAEPLLANLLLDSQRIQCRRVCVPEGMKPQRSRAFFTSRSLFDGSILAHKFNKQFWVEFRNF